MLFTLAGPRWTNLLTGAGVTVLVYALFRFRRQTEGKGAAFYWTLASCFICLAMYYCFYDASLMAVALAAAFDLYRRRNRAAWLWAAALAPLAVPGSTLPHAALRARTHDLPLVEPLLIRHDAIALMVLASMAIAGISRLSREPVR